VSGESFRFVQLDYAGALGPSDGRYVLRDEPQGPPRRVVVLTTLDRPPRRPKRAKRAKDVESSSPPPVTRATLIEPTALGSTAEASSWLSALRSDSEAMNAVVAEAARVLNGLVRAHRVAAGDPFSPHVSAAGALVARVGHGSGDEVADGRFAEAYEAPGCRRRTRRGELLEPQERLIRFLGGHRTMPASEELVLRARVDVEAGRPREAALQARVALEALLAELEGDETHSSPDHGDLVEARPGVSEAANAALRGDPPVESQAHVSESVALMARAVRRRALSEGVLPS
jgi:hypothetical protein